MAGLDLHLDLGGRRLRAGLERELREAVRGGRLKPGTRLPSSRVLAADLGIARNTVAEAYTQLVAEGWLDASKGRGTSVARTLPGARPAQGDGPGPRPRFDLRPGVPDVSEFPRDSWTAAYRRALMTETAESLAYGDPQGHPRLREVLAAYLGRARGVNAAADQIVICNGATHGLSMLAAALRHVGRTALAMESYCFPVYHRVATRQGLDVIALPLDDEGAVVEGLWQTSAAAAVLTPAHQFPTGVPLSPARREEALRWAEVNDTVLVEDDYDGEFRYGLPRVGSLQASDPDHVIYLGSLSKTLAPGLRLGWMAVPHRWVDTLVRVRQATDLHPGVAEQLALAEYIRCADLDRHLRAARLRYRRRREQLQHALAAQAPVLGLRGVPAGLHGLVDLPGGYQSEIDVLARASAQGLALAGISQFRIAAPDSDTGGLVIGYARPPGHAFRGALETLLDVLPR